MGSNQVLEKLRDRVSSLEQQLAASIDREGQVRKNLSSAKDDKASADAHLLRNEEELGKQRTLFDNQLSKLKSDVDTNHKEMQHKTLMGMLVHFSRQTAILCCEHAFQSLLEFTLMCRGDEGLNKLKVEKDSKMPPTEALASINDRRALQKQLADMRKRQSALEKDSPENLRLTSQLQKVRRDIKALQEKENGAILERDELIQKIGQPGTDGDDHVDAAAVYLDGSKGAVGGGPSGLYLERISLQSKVRALADTAEQRAAEIKDVLQSEAQLKHENYLALQRRVCELLCKNIFFGRRHLLDTAFRHMRKVLYRVTEAKESAAIFFTYTSRRELSLKGIAMGVWRCFCVYQSPALEEYKKTVSDVNNKHTKWKDMRTEKDELQHTVKNLKGQVSRLNAIVKGVKDGESYDIAEKDMRIRSSLMKKECERSSAYNIKVEANNEKLKEELLGKEKDINELANKNKILHEKAKLLRDSEVRNNQAQDEVRRLRAVEIKYSNHMRRMFLRRVSSFIGGSENRFALAAVNQWQIFVKAMEREEYKSVKAQMEEELERELERGMVLEDELDQATSSRELHRELVNKLTDQLNGYKKGPEKMRMTRNGTPTRTKR